MAEGDIPPFGAVLVLATGRRYQIVGGKGRSLQALVLPPDAPIEPGTEIWSWAWSKRQSRPRR